MLPHSRLWTIALKDMGRSLPTKFAKDHCEPEGKQILGAGGRRLALRDRRSAPLTRSNKQQTNNAARERIERLADALKLD